MPASYPPTPYPEVNLVLDGLLPDVRAVLADRFIGMYLYGSLANGDFDSASDVDYLAVTDGEVSDETFRALDAMHQHIAALESWCAT